MILFKNELEQMIARKNLMNSYKLYFLKALIVNGSTEKLQFGFYEMASWMCAYSFRDVCVLGRRIRPLDKLYDTAVVAIEKENLMESSSISEVYDAVFNTDDSELYRMVASLCHYVPYRLLAYMWPQELKGKNDREKNRFIEEMSQSEDKCMYSIFLLSNDSKCIEIYFEWVSYIAHNRKELIAWIDHKIYSFIGKE